MNRSNTEEKSKSEKRRENILEYLPDNTPVTGNRLGKLLDVSRQVIVQDIAILRAKGYRIMSTPQGYLNIKEKKLNKHRFKVASKHDKSGIKEELEIIVDLGGKVIDVLVEHPIYGEISGYLMIKSRRDVSEFLDRLYKSNAQPLSYLTGGIHLHMIEVSEIEVEAEIKDALKKNGFLIE